METTDIVFRDENGTPVTTSILMAETFGKKHCHVLRDIDNLECSKEFLESNFGFSVRIRELPSGYTTEDRFYYITKDGFTFLAMGYTGKKAAEFKEKYIAAFNAMQQTIEQGIQKSPSVSEQFMERQMQLMNQMMSVCGAMQQRMDRMERYFNIGVYGTAEQVVHLKSAPRFQPSSPAMVKASGGTMRRYRTPGHLTVAEASKELVSRGVFIFQTALYRYLRENGYLCCDEQRYNLPTEMCIKNKWMIFVNAGTGVGKKHANGKRRYFTPYLSGEFVDLLEQKLREMNCNDPGGYQLGLDFGKEVQG